MKLKKRNRLLEGKSRWIIFSTIIFAILGIVALILGYGLTEGWSALLAWFSSRWAIYVYIIIGLLGFLVAWIIYKIKMGGED